MYRIGETTIYFTKFFNEVPHEIKFDTLNKANIDKYVALCSEKIVNDIAKSDDGLDNY